MKKIVIFSSYGGGGHTAVANALSSYLKDEYEIVTTNIFSQVLAPLDLMQTVSSGRYTGEDIYNYLMPRKYYGLINLYYKLGAWYFKFRQKKVRKNIEDFLQMHKPDIVISVIPIVNYSVLAVTQKLNLPFLLIPTDLDITTFIAGIKAPTYDQFKIGLAFEDDEARIRLAEAQIPLDVSIVTGFVVRPDFFQTKDIAQIKKEFDVPEGKPVVLLMLGAVGLQSLLSFSKQLSNIESSAHILICTSRQEAIKKSIDALTFPAPLSKTTIGFTSRISDLMAISDIFITKSGSVSVCEAMYMNLPMILDATTDLLAWEKANHRFVKRHHFGTIIEDQDKLAGMVTEMLKNPELCNEYKARLTLLEKKYGCEEIKLIIASMITLNNKVD
ncbi:MAG: glycosyltransferase [Candidatus Babeliales bacterium]|nr:glycosyltransferase [Candidatus Babeliales bacterium]